MKALIPGTDFGSSARNVLLPGPVRSSVPTSLVEIVQVAMREIDESRLQPAPRTALALPSKVLLALLAYCYAREVYGSQRIAKCIARNRTFRAVCGSGLPDARAIREFRELNRAAIQRCLNTMLLFLAWEQAAPGAVTPVDEIFVADEANRRIIMAACIDRLELENGSRPANVA